MPKLEPDVTDPMELAGVAFDDPTGQSVRVMAECFADEFLRLGHSVSEVMDLFRGSEHRLAHHAWERLGDLAVFAMVQEMRGRHDRIRECFLRSRKARGIEITGS
jgi:hypothetical protein